MKKVSKIIMLIGGIIMAVQICGCQGVTNDKKPGNTKNPSINYSPKGVRATGQYTHPEEYINFTEDQIRDQVKAGYQMRNGILRAIRDGESSYTIEAGYYRIDTEILIEGAKDFTIEAEDGAFLIINNKTYKAFNAIRLNNCKNVTIRGLSIDMNVMPFFQGTIISYDQASSGVQVVFDDGYYDSFEYFISVYDGAIHRIMYYDKDANENQIALSAHANGAFCGATLTGKTGDNKNIYKLEMTGAIHGSLKPEIEVGDKVLIPITGGGGALTLEYCDHCLIENVNIYASSSFCVGDNFGVGGNTYKNVYIGRRPGTNRLICGSSDGMHFISAQEGPVLDNCEISYVCDDSFNCHTFMGMTVEKLAANEYIVMFPMISFLEEGSELKFFNYLDYMDKGTAVVTKAEQITSGEWYQRLPGMRDEFIQVTGFSIIRGFDQPMMYKITLDKEMDLPAFTGISNYGFACENALIKDTFFHDVNGNGIVTRSNGITVENTTVARVCLGVAVSGGGNWTEGPIPRNVTIKNCVFEETNQSFEGGGSGSINIEMGSYGQAPTGNDIIKDVSITDCTFINVSGPLVRALNSKGIVINNIIADGTMTKGNPNYYPHKECYLFAFGSCSDIDLGEYKATNSGSKITGDVSGIK